MKLWSIMVLFLMFLVVPPSIRYFYKSVLSLVSFVFCFFLTRVGPRESWSPCGDEVRPVNLTATQVFVSDSMFTSSLLNHWRFTSYQHQLENCASTSWAYISGRASSWGNDVVPLPAWLCHSPSLSLLLRSQLLDCPACIYKMKSVIVALDPWPPFQRMKVSCKDEHLLTLSLHLTSQ